MYATALVEGKSIQFELSPALTREHRGEIPEEADAAVEVVRRTRLPRRTTQALFPSNT